MFNMFFKSLTTFDYPSFGFKILFPKNAWKYKKISNKCFIFLKKNTSYALILEIFDEKEYNYALLDNELNNHYTKMNIGDYESYVVCKRFEESPILQYEWNFIDSSNKILFTYCISDNLKESEKDILYQEIINILNTLMNKS
jgi:hypothetical protein